MGTQLLAQMVVSDETRAALEAKRAQFTCWPLIERCIKSLSMPWDGGNHVTLPHPSLGVVYAREAEATHAPVYHFDQHAINAMHVLTATRRRQDLITQIARAPAPRCWLEWTDLKARNYCGVYIEGDRNGARFLGWGKFMDEAASREAAKAAGVTMYRHQSQPICVPSEEGEFRIDEHNMVETTYRTTHAIPGAVRRAMEAQQRADHTAQRLPMRVLLLWAFLATTGAVSVSRTPAPRGSAKFIRYGVPILSYNKVRLALPRDLIERDGVVCWERGPGVRRHQVEAHPHIYHVGPRADGHTVVRWVLAYWRGQERKGLVLKAKEVTA